MVLRAFGALIVLLLVSATARGQGVSISLMPIETRWARAGDASLVSDALIAAGGDADLSIKTPSVDTSGCFGRASCYLHAAEEAALPVAVAVDVVRTSSGRLHVRFYLVNTRTHSVQDLGLIRSQPGALRSKLGRVADLLRAAAPKVEEMSSSPLPVAPPPAPLPPVAVPPPLEVSVPWYQSIGVNAFVSTAFTYNVNRPPTGTNALRVFDDRHAQPSVDVAELVIQRPAENSGDAGFRFDFVAGSAIPRVSASAGLFRDHTGKAGDADLQQAFVSYVARIGHGLRADAGKFVTPVGAEVIEGFDGYGDQYSRSFLFGYAIPFTHTGLRLAYPFSNRVSVTTMLTSGWDVVRDNNRAPSGGAVVAFQPIADLTVSAGYLVGPERPGDTRTLRHLVDIVVSSKLGRGLTFTANSDWARDGGERWYGLAGYLRFDLNQRVAMSLRAEGFEDPDGARTQTAQHLWEVTITAATRIGPGMLVRFELRQDHSSESVFPARSGNLHYQLTSAINAVFAI